MCLIVWNWQPGSRTELILLSNRDEFHERPALPVHWWDCDPTTPQTQVLAGKDLQAGGTWLGVSRNARLAAITNFRSGTALRPDARTRGELVSQFLQGTQDAADFVQTLQTQCADYNPFNLLVFDGQRLLGLESRHARIVELAPGWGGVSNADFNTPWPKLQRLQQRAQALPDTADRDTWHDHALLLLQDRTPAAPQDLPQTGVSQALEQALSPIFIDLPHYGTRSSSVVTVNERIRYTEQVYAGDGTAAPPQRFSFGVPKVA